MHSQSMTRRWLLASRCVVLACAVMVVACQTAPSVHQQDKKPGATASLPQGQGKPPVQPSTESTVQPTPFALLTPATWEALPGISDENWLVSWPVWLKSCQGLKLKPDWREVCALALTVNASDAQAIQAYWQQYFSVYATRQNDATQQGLMTGYYQPILKGAAASSQRYNVPLYQLPSDLITVNLSGLFPELKYKRVRGRVQGQTLVPYWTRAEIEQPVSPLAGSELLWVEDAVEAFFLQVQGSGVVEYENGERVHIGYADQNGHPYQSIGKLLVERGEMTASEASMQSIKAWGRQHPDQLRSLLDANPSYVFFKRLPAGLSGPLGALGVPLTAERSIAVDPLHIPLGAPVYLSTTYPNTESPFQQLMMAQDTGGAIKGGVRADIFWGEGESAGKFAGAMRQQGRLWVWLPKTFKLPH